MQHLTIPSLHPLVLFPASAKTITAEVKAAIAAPILTFPVSFLRIFICVLCLID